MNFMMNLVVVCYLGCILCVLSLPTRLWMLLKCFQKHADKFVQILLLQWHFFKKIVLKPIFLKPSAYPKTTLTKIPLLTCERERKSKKFKDFSSFWKNSEKFKQETICSDWILQVIYFSLCLLKTLQLKTLILEQRKSILKH